jgi:transketolase
MKIKNSLDELCINTISTLSMDAVQKANSGHPGAPMGLAPIAYTLWTRFLKHNPGNPDWYDRDRFVLSAGHASMLLYSLLHLTGYGISLDELKEFRQWGSRTPGHPEHGLTPGVETTTGPLGQGISNAVGMAIAEKWLAQHFNRPEFNLVDHYTYVIASDGDMMEGVASEAASIGGHLGLSKLICFYDDNHITIEGCTDLAFSEDVCKRFEAYGWHTQKFDDDIDLDDLSKAIQNAQADKERPSLIAVRTHIGCGSPNKQDSEKAHGEPLGEEEILLTKKNLGWESEEPFYVPVKALEHFRQALSKGCEVEYKWDELFEAYAKKYPDLAKEWHAFMHREFSDDWKKAIPVFTADKKGIATRSASGTVLNVIASHVTNLVGGSADLAPSTKTNMDKFGSITRDDFSGRNMHFGIREHGMGAIVNGMALHKGLVPYGATFMVFSDYMRPSIRLSAIMEQPSIWIFTHDSIGVGEDGPTHQPIEHLAALRSIPELVVIRPADANETAAAWRIAMESKNRPVAMALTRQNLPILDPSEYPMVSEGVERGAYILVDTDGNPDIILIGTGSELNLVLDAAKQLKEKGVKARVVSMPSWELFDEQNSEYQEKVFPPSVKARLAVEAGITQGWCRYVGLEGDVIGIDHYGASAPGGTVFKQFGFTVENVVGRAMVLLKR